MKAKGFVNHIYAESRDEAIETTRRQYPHSVIEDACLDPDWAKTKHWNKRWAVKVAAGGEDEPGNHLKRF